MVNYTYAFSQSESGKYFEWIIKVVNNNRWCIQAKKINAFNQSLKTAWFLFMSSLVFTDLQVKSRTLKQSIPFFQFLSRLDITQQGTCLILSFIPGLWAAELDQRSLWQRIPCYCWTRWPWRPSFLQEPQAAARISHSHYIYLCMSARCG